MIIFAIALAVVAITALIGSRVWLLRRISDAEKSGERPFDYEDRPVNPYESR